MKQCFRFMGMPDKVLAFDALPERFLKGFELCGTDGFPRHWKDWLGKMKKEVKIPPEKDFLTGQVRYFESFYEEGSYFYLVDWTLGPVVEKWGEICDFVRQNVPKDFRLKEKIEDMALPLAANKTDGVTLEPEDVVVIPIPLELQEIKVKLVTPSGSEVKKEVVSKIEFPHGTIYKCEEAGCTSEFEGKYGKNSLRMHMKKHDKTVAA